MKEQGKEYEVTTENIFADLGLQKADELAVRSDVMRRVCALINDSKLPQAEVAKKLRISQPQVSLLISGRLSSFSLETLLLYLMILGCEIKINIKRPRSKIGIFKHKGSISIPARGFFSKKQSDVEKRKCIQALAYRKNISLAKRKKKRK